MTIWRLLYKALSLAQLINNNANKDWKSRSRINHQISNIRNVGNIIRK